MNSIMKAVSSTGVGVAAALRFAGIAACGLALLVPAAARAQGYGLPVVDSAETKDPGYVSWTLGTVLGLDTQSIGVRSTTTIQKGLRVFVDLSGVNPEEGDGDLAAQGGAVVSLNVDSPFAMAARGTIYGMNGDDMEVLGGSGMLLAGRETVVEGLFLYTGLGLDYRSTTKHHGAEEQTVNGKLTVTPAHDSTDDKASPLWALGALVPMNKNISFFTELTVTDDVFVGLGLRFQ